jgi:hypothetical protein
MSKSRRAPSTPKNAKPIGEGVAEKGFKEIKAYNETKPLDSYRSGKNPVKLVIQAFDVRKAFLIIYEVNRKERSEIVF